MDPFCTAMAGSGGELLMLTIAQLIEAYLDHMRKNRRKPSTGAGTRTWKNIRSATRPLYAATHSTCGEPLAAMPVTALTRAELKRLQRQLADSGRMTRRSVNDAINWVRTMYRWAADEELVPEDTALRLTLVKPLQLGKTSAREARRVRSVPLAQVEATCLYASPKLATMIWVAWHTGMRPGEVCGMRRGELDTSGAVWVYRPRSHKTEHYGCERVVLILPKAREALEAWMARLPAGADVLFEGVERGILTGQPMRQQSFYNSVRRLNKANGLDHWWPNQLRHAFATRVEREWGKKTASLLLGHTNEKTTDVYLDGPDLSRLMQVASMIE